MENTILKKKNSLIFILDILKTYSDADSPLTIAKIEELLLAKYELKVGRKAIKRNLENLLELGYEIEYDVQNRKGKNGEDEEIKTNWYLIRDFSDSELRLIIESLLFSKYIADKHKKELIGKIERLSNEKFKSRIKHVKTVTDHSLDSKELFHTIEIVDEAIAENKQILFKYNYYKSDKKKYNYKNAAGQPRKYVVSPYYIAFFNNRYYLICNHKNNDELYNYRLDRMTGICMLEDELRKPITELNGFKEGFDLSTYMSEHLYMFSGEVAPVTFKIKKQYVGDVIDWFGKEIHFFDETQDEVTVSTRRVNLNAMKIWAVQYGANVQVIRPQKLIDRVKEDLQQALRNYDNAPN
ncbi:hypothetical protein BTS2_2968 [Bacillus sp. TS-2]|nr:hypothetical protein BTS2_2968 [Bacillus sp. TS-2]